MVVRPARLGALLQSIKDTPGTWQDRVPPGWAMSEAVKETPGRERPGVGQS
ncbi:hypothetical protein PQR67_00715 [Paraburkholderia fungorum]|uniref:hypothetical protein n=1 Tax=Paraburkholderia fungorum TaxID=134537 RepID=UPI0038B8EFDE